MLQLAVMLGDSVDTFPIDILRDFTTRVFLHCDMPEEDARLAADVLAVGDLRGIESHGIARLWAYVRLFEQKAVNPRPMLKVIHETPSTATVDGDGGLGLVVGPKANRIALEKASEVGTGWVAVRKSSHFGIAGYYALMAVQRDMIGWSMTNSSALVAPLGGIDRRLGTNPLAVAFPAGDEQPIVIDMATSVVSGGKIEIARYKEEQVPDGWLLDDQGRPTNDSNALHGNGSLLPLGGDRERGGHKGYCLAAMVDLLCGVLSGADWGPLVSGFAVANIDVSSDDSGGWGHFFGAMQIDAFSNVTEFKQRVDDWICSMRSSRPQAGTEGPLIPGEPEYLATVERTQSGIPLSPRVVESLRNVIRQTGVRLKGITP